MDWRQCKEVYMELFKVGEVDFTEYIIASSYDVDQEDVYTEWRDIFYNLHRSSVRTQIAGSFTLCFANDEQAFRDFVDLVKVCFVDRNGPFLSLI